LESSGRLSEIPITDSLVRIGNANTIPAGNACSANTGYRGGHHQIDQIRYQHSRFDQRTLIARAITRAAMARETMDSKTIISLAQTRTADTSAGLNAKAVLNDRTR